MMRILVTVVMSVLVLAGCGSEPAQEPDAGSPPVVMDVTSGRPLSEFEGLDSYPWRKRLVKTQDVVLERMQGISTHLEERDLRDVLNTCDAISRGIKGNQLIEETVSRFSGGSGSVDAAEAQALIAVSKKNVCP